MQNIKFGVEIEYAGLTRCAAAKVVAAFFNSTATHIGGTYDAYTVRDDQDRLWKILSDASIKCENRNGEPASRLYSVELVTPICTYDDIEKIQEIVRRLRKAKAHCNKTTGIHVHIDASNHSVRTLKNVVNIMAAKEDLLYKTLNVEVERERFCKKVDTKFLEELNNKKVTDMASLEQLWYKGRSGRYEHYHNSRYKALNLHSVFSKGTVEFRIFNSSIHSGEIKSYIQLCLAINKQALIQKRALPAKTVSTNEKYTFRTWLLRLGLIGDEFKTTRLHLLKNLDGNIAWKDPAQAEAQKIRMALKKQEENSRETLRKMPGSKKKSILITMKLK